MNDTIRELISRVLDYVWRTPRAEFKIARWSEEVLKIRAMHSIDCNPVYFTYCVHDSEEAHFISRQDDDKWSWNADLTEDNLRYLLSQLEGDKLD